MGKCRRAFFYRAFRLFGKEIMSKINNETAVLEDGLNKDLPYERCLALGPAVLKDEELLAVILRTGTLGKNATDLAREILKLGRLSPGGGHGNPLQSSCLGNSMGRGAWQARVAQSRTQLK